MKTSIIFLIAFTFISFDRGQKYKDPRKMVYDHSFIEKNMAYIPTGSFNMGPDEDVPQSHNTKARTVSVESFYMFNQEVTNGLYLDYVKQLKKKGDTAAYRKALPDTSVWENPHGWMKPYVEYYFRHPAYAYYPLVGVTHEQCIDFCKWLTTTYNAAAKRKYKKVVFDLPGEAQWEYAARGGLSLSPFPWGGPYMQDSKGQYMANFRQFSQSGICREEYERTSTKTGEKYMDVRYVAIGGGDIMGVAGRLNDAADITANVQSFKPNAYKLWNMAGNVEEFIKEPGKTRGGSWRDPGYYLQNSVAEEYDISNSASCERGFRFVMRIIEE